MRKIRDREVIRLPFKRNPVFAETRISKMKKKRPILDTNEKL